MTWAERFAEWLPQFRSDHPQLSLLAGGAALLHGSTTLGVDDPYSDLDIWLLCPADILRRFDAVSPTRFIPFELDGKKGHINVEAVEEIMERVERCDLPLIFELRHTTVLSDSAPQPTRLISKARHTIQIPLHDPQQAIPLTPTARQPTVALSSSADQATRLMAKACQTMREEVRLAWFHYHYFRMRQAHRVCDNPIERGDSVAVLFGATETIKHALCAAMVLDGEPYPYDKWLGHQAALTHTGKQIAPLVEDALTLLAGDVLRHPGPEASHPLSLRLREMRNVLIASARGQEIDPLWLTEWWLYIDQAKAGIADLTLTW